jgi:hypothetical protein
MMTQDELRDLAGGDAARAAALERATQVTARGKTELPVEFNAALRARLTEPVAAPRRRKFPALLGYAAMLAAGVLLGVAIMTDTPRFDPLGANVSWAQVVQAVERVEYFHATFVADEPRNADRDDGRPSLYRIDWFYQRPGTWRAQGLDYVQFSTGKERIYSIKDNAWVPADQVRVRFIRRDMDREFAKNDMLSVVLGYTFSGKPPAGEPVKNPDLAASGIEVFDYATNDPTADWARIWVLKQSRTPLRAKVFSPARDSSLLIEFDYTDPQPPAFFDPQAFDTGLKELKKLGFATPNRIYALGSAPVGGTKPRTAAQIYSAAGGYHAPTIRRALSNADGDIALITSTPSNRNPSGRQPDNEGYADITDNWGNRYVPVTSSKGVHPDDDTRWYFTPVTEPLKTGPVPHRLTLRYTLEVLENGMPAPLTQTLTSETVDVPDASVPGQPKDWDNAYQSFFESQKPVVRRNFLCDTAPLAVQLAKVEAALAKNPDSVDDLRWKFNLYRHFGRDDQAWTFFETQLVNRILKDGATFYSYSGYENARALSRYLVHLVHADRTQEFDRILAQLREIRDRDLASTDRVVRSNAQSTFQSEHAWLFQVLHLPEWQKLIREQPPKVTNVIAAKDGMICVQLRVPLQPAGWRATGGSSGDHWSLDFGWFWDPSPLSRDWNIRGRRVDTTTGDVWLALAPLGNPEPAKLDLGNTVYLIGAIGDLFGGQDQPVLHTWSVNADIPAPTLDALAPWWAEQTKGKNAFWVDYQPPPVKPEETSVGPWLAQAADAAKAGQPSAALDLYRRILAAPDAQWPAYYRDPQESAGYLENTRREVHARIVAILAQTGRLDEARKEADTLRATLAPKPDFRDPADITARQHARTADLAIVRALMAARQLPEARQLMAALEAPRPDLAAIPDEQIDVSRQPGVHQMRDLRDLHRSAWKDFDVLWWDLQDALPPQP